MSRCLFVHASAALLVNVLLPTVEAAPQAVKLEELLDRASAYERHFIDELSSVVAEERYEQVFMERGARSGPRGKRVLVSDFLLVTRPGATVWQVFRQVLEVDGKPVANPDDSTRLIELFSKPTSDTLRRADEIAAEGARYNLLDIGTLNNPLMAIAFLQPEYRTRFRFKLGGLAKDLGPNVRTVHFEERVKPTILRSGAKGNLFSSGLLLIEEDSGRVVKTRFIASLSGQPIANVETEFAFDDTLKVNVPVRMRDWYPAAYDRTFIGEATYGRFRRFQVVTEQRLNK